VLVLQQLHVMGILFRKRINQSLHLVVLAIQQLQENLFNHQKEQEISQL
jgi:hypothetical protein